LDKDKIYSILGTLLFHLIILVILGFTVLRTTVPDEEAGILVNFGNVDAAAGTFEPQYTGVTPPQQTVVPASPRPVPARENLLTQDVEESVSIAEAARKREERRKEEERRKAEEEVRRQAEQKQQQQDAISNRVAGAFGAGSAAGNSQGDAPAGSGNQGNPFGNSDQGANTGVGGYGSFNLNGRSLAAGGLPRPAYNVQEEGRIVINITVDPKGSVISSEIAIRGTNIDNASMRQSALEAARRARFNSITGSNNQSGTITYIYTLK
jgi:TonB family protein